ncbi:hypothetical protein POM88_033719 [Heracleum sosnowskyi]|uniref:F-box domain-containing protein n=1 Tax=Heracleum sosnowskyi TaxID=360622 RepID=A0AAD8HHX4_9APIA|nr:hypothetical protein POM88_033717 [Heracleum sosnowskyi]KAK1367627.1 hypothetical protein POM88_033719 [Heracleum sosnowskyi]
MRGTHFTDLHEHIILEILCFLTAKFIIRCSCVCKDWAKLIYQPYFTHVYLSKRKAPLQLVLEKNNNLVLATLDENLYIDTSPHNILVPSELIFDLNIRRFFDVQPSVCLEIFTCKVTGWILATDQAPYSYLGKEYECQPYHIYNPITGQHIVVEKVKRADIEWSSCALIFAEKTNQLKLLGFYSRKGSRRLEADVQTIGSNAWRSIGATPCDREGCELPVLLNGHCHWLDCDKAVVNCFDSEKEVFQVIQTPPGFMHYMSNNNINFSNIGSVNGCLCLSVGSMGNEHNSFELWVMNKYGNQDSWIKKYVLYDLRIFYPGALLEPLTCLENGEILMLWDRSTLILGDAKTNSTMICYNPQLNKYRYFMFDEVTLSERNA